MFIKQENSKITAKVIVLIAVTLLFYLASCNNPSYVIPNSSFDYWTEGNNAKAPKSWFTTLETSDIFGSAFQTVFQDSMGKDKLGARMQVVGNDTMSIPALLSTGDIVHHKGGIAFTQRPASFGGWIHYSFLSNDSLFVSVLLSKWNTKKGRRILIGEFRKTFAGKSGSEYEPFTDDLLYYNNYTPDTCVILFFLGKKTVPRRSGTVGSYACVDELFFKGTAPQTTKNINVQYPF